MNNDMTDSFTSGPFIIGGILFSLISIVSFWIIFRKSGRPGWWAIIPFVNTFQMCKVAGKPGWWMFLLFIPIVNLVILVLVYHGISLNFGKSAGFTVGIIFLPFIFLPILAFGPARYNGYYGVATPAH